MFQVFVRHFTLGLQYELQSHGISVQLLSPFCVQTKLHTYPITEVVGNIFFPPVQVFAKSAVFTLGKTNETTGYWAHAIMVCIYNKSVVGIMKSDNLLMVSWQNGALRILPVYIRTLIMGTLSRRIREAHYRERGNTDSATETIDG